MARGIFNSYNAVPPPASLAGGGANLQQPQGPAPAAPGPPAPHDAPQASSGGGSSSSASSSTWSLLQEEAADSPTGTGLDAPTLASLGVSPLARGVGTPLSIPLDGGAHGSNAVRLPIRTAKKAAAGPHYYRDLEDSGDEDVAHVPGAYSGPVPRRPLSSRDSQRRRNALLKGREGTRARRRWENGAFVLCRSPLA